VSFKGCKVLVENEQTETGNRASPTVSINTNDYNSVSAHIQNFWESFPKAIAVHKDDLIIELFPKKINVDHELQGGEQKTHTVYLEVGTTPNQINQITKPLQVTIPLSTYSAANAMPMLPESYSRDEIDKTIHYGIAGEDSIFQKREKADEYGWRHFGELWADHKTLEHGNEDSLVSHYNNQYDPIYGFTRQYILSGDPRWQTLTEDIVRHVLDIDIYHTNHDRPEYNQGQFWHTDHYLDGRHYTQNLLHTPFRHRSC
jgi:hypothetical protein